MSSVSNRSSSHDSSDTDSEEDFQKLKLDRADGSIYGPLGSREASVCWFKATQARNIRDNTTGQYFAWFHGIISRKFVLYLDHSTLHPSVPVNMLYSYRRLVNLYIMF